MSRDDVVSVLSSKMEEGIFLIRKSVNSTDPVLSFVHNGKVRHSRIQSGPKGFFLGDGKGNMSFKSVEALVEAYIADKTLLKPYVLSPVVCVPRNSDPFVTFVSL